MNGKEFTFKGMQINGFLMLLVNLLLPGGLIWAYAGVNQYGGIAGLIGSLLAIAAILVLFGFISQEPNKARIMVFFGQYKGTFTKTGFFWVKL